MRTDLLRRPSHIERLRRILVPLSGAALLLAACSSQPPPAPPVVVVAPKLAAAPQASSAGAPIMITMEKRPEKLAVDGALDEWPYFTQGDQRPSAPRSAEEQGAESFMVMAVSPEGVSLAAELVPGAGEALWLAVAPDVPELPPPLECDAESMEPDELATCKADAAANVAFSAEHVARFRRFYRFDAAGVSVHDKGALTAVAGARVAVEEARNGHRLEATLPPGALPRTLQAPLSQLYVYAVASSGQAPPVLPIEELVPLRLDEPVGFEPHAALRQAVFANALGRSLNDLDMPFNISYQPGGDLELEDVRYRGAAGTQLYSKQELLYSKQAVLGAVEVGYVYTGTSSVWFPWLSVIAQKDGELLEIADLGGAAKGVVQRDGEVHVFAYWARKSEGSPASTVAWSVLAIDAEGAVRFDVLDNTPELVELIAPVESHAPDFSTLSLAGTVWDSATKAPGAPIQATWKYDAKERRYLPTVKGGPPAAKKGGHKKAVAKKK